MRARVDDDPSVLRQRVTSKGGTTEQAITSFENAGFHNMVKDALQEAHDRSRTMANELGKDS